MRQLFTRRKSLLNGGFDPDAQLFIDNAGITNETQQNAINQLVLDLKGFNIWLLMDAVYPYVGGTESQHKFNLRNPLDTDAAFRITFAGTWTHNANGSKPSTNSTKGNTHFTPSVDGVDSDSGLTNTFFDTNTENGSAFGTRDGSNNNFSLLQRNDLSGGRMYDLGGRFFNDLTGDAKGTVTNTRTGNLQEIYKNGGFLDSKPTAVGSLPITEIAVNMDGITGGVKTFCFDAIHRGLDSQEVIDLHTTIDTFSTSLSRKTW